MSKYGATKDKILELIANGNSSLSSISKELNLAPSTVSKHLRDLEGEGRIEMKDNAHFRKWKFYTLSGNANNGVQAPMESKARMVARTFILLLVITAIGAYAFSANGGTVQIPIRITDPPEVPQGTQALYINYSSIAVAVARNGGMKWITSNSSGTLNLMRLINYTQIVGEIAVGQGSTVDSVVLNITSASIVIDNETYPVHLLGNEVTATVEKGKELNKSSDVLLDFAPIVTPEYTKNSTTFVMLPYLRAFVTQAPEEQKGRTAITGAEAPYPLDPHYRNIFSRESWNITITNVKLVPDGNKTEFSVTLSNKGNRSADILGVVIYENPPSFFNTSNFSERWPAWAESGLGQNSTQYPQGTDTGPKPGNDNGPRLPDIGGAGSIGDNVPQGPQGADRIVRRMNCSANLNGPTGPMTIKWCQQSNSSIEINASAISDIMPYLGGEALGAKLTTSVNDIIISGSGERMGPGPAFMLAHPAGINFIVDKNGTLAMPEQRIGDNSIGAAGYTLAANTSITLVYRGVLGIGERVQNTSSIRGISIITDRGIIHNITAGARSI